MRKPPTPDAQLLRALTTPVVGAKDWAQIALTIPVAHIRVLDSESQLLGLRRSQFLELLVLNRLGERTLTRMSIAPTYRLGRKELAETERYLWYVRREVKKLLDEYLLRLGMRPSAFIVLLLNEWAGLGPEVPR